MRAEVVGVIVAVADGTPLVLARGTPPALPAGPLLDEQPSLQASTRAWVEERTGHPTGYLEQLYTFADAGRPGDEHVVSVSYLGLASAPSDGADAADATAVSDWRGWYELFPWEDRRSSDAALAPLLPHLEAWAAGDESRRARVAVTFGLDGRTWQPDMVLHRYELLYEAGLLPESPADGRRDALAPGVPMAADHRRITATGLARLRAKIQYRPVVFELLPDEFTLGELQRCVEAIAGQTVHTQNFRRTVEQQALVKETGNRSTGTGGRPAKLYRFRRSVLLERQVVGTKVPVARPR